MDADGEHSISNINKSYIYCKKNKIDLLIGSRSRMNRFSEKYISKLFFKKYNIRDPLSGFKIYNSKKLSKISSIFQSIGSNQAIIIMIAWNNRKRNRSAFQFFYEI